ncbi:hypothetical protein [Paenibacillus sp. NAIST15-1]|uniref:hypothetical protein n=1 Tax=Paenibacillus sp. NAIST15-1 TaxID=1605994 RepID=UPI000869611C|nr:hypothetical protein [Paenibacillus sp. NAIST15-1]GAV15208.1 hypothetical protein PBN151_5187 [Paenibacillus sp. NAIST15-1]
MKVASKVAITALSSVLMLGSSSVNLMAEAAPSRTSSNMTVKTAAAKPELISEGARLVEEEKDKINKLLEKNPNDTYMLYVSSELKKEKENIPEGWISFSEVSFMGSPRTQSFDTYEAYIKRASALKEAVPQQPADLPEGYRLSKADIYSVFTPKDLAAIKAEAKKLGKQVYSKKMNMIKSDHISLTYTKGQDFINIASFHWDENDLEEYKKKKEKEYSYTSAKDMEKKNPNHEGRNYLSWREDGKSFQVETNKNNPLTKEELIMLAKTVVKK